MGARVFLLCNLVANPGPEKAPEAPGSVQIKNVHEKARSEHFFRPTPKRDVFRTMAGLLTHGPFCPFELVVGARVSLLCILVPV